jgi:hypothetical protein
VKGLIGLLIVAGTASLAVLKTLIKADLEDATVCQWVARQLIYAAAQRLPRGQRTRWREEWIRHALDVPGRTGPLARALAIYFRAGGWGRMLRGAPSPSQALVARVRAAWQRLRSLLEARARTRSKERHPAFSTRAQAPVEAEVTQAMVATVTGEATLTARSTTRSTGRAILGYSPETAFARYRKSLPHLSDEEVVTLLSQSPQEFVANLDRRIDEWRQEQWRLLGREPG